MKYFFIFLCLLGCLTANAVNRALIVGIGDYDTDKTGWRLLHGDKDVDLLVESLKSAGFDEKNIKTLKNSQATKKEIVKNLKELSSKVKSGDIVIFHFSGHGQPVTDLNGDEKNGVDEAVVPFDAYRTPKYKIGARYYQGENHLIDDELNPIFNEIKKKIGKKGYFLVTIDACYSRGIEMETMGHLLPEELERVGEIRGTDHVFKANDDGILGKIPQPKQYSPGGKMTVISACREDEQNFEYKVPGSEEIYGSLSYTLCLLLREGYSFGSIEKYFKNREHSRDKIFVKEQHPKIKTYQ